MEQSSDHPHNYSQLMLPNTKQTTESCLSASQFPSPHSEIPNQSPASPKGENPNQRPFRDEAGRGKVPTKALPRARPTNKEGHPGVLTRDPVTQRRLNRCSPQIPLPRPDGGLQTQSPAPEGGRTQRGAGPAGEAAGKERAGFSLLRKPRGSPQNQAHRSTSRKAAPVAQTANLKRRRLKIPPVLLDRGPQTAGPGELQTGRGAAGPEPRAAPSPCGQAPTAERIPSPRGLGSLTLRRPGVWTQLWKVLAPNSLAPGRPAPFGEGPPRRPERSEPRLLLPPGGGARAGVDPRRAQTLGPA
uniref:Proline-rich protein HaeIII subfamily 1-like n=1 Tax=Camelus bactrianus TaxID=9837 RepID=A0A9W3EWM3_CAMBA|nr:proline-rich protein HaeIII subfamily 1-like [Camelus bactrianus]